MYENRMQNLWEAGVWSFDELIPYNKRFSAKWLDIWLISAGSAGIDNYTFNFRR